MLAALASTVHYVGRIFPSIPNLELLKYRAARRIRRGTYYTRYSWWKLKLSWFRTMTQNPMIFCKSHYRVMGIFFLSGLLAAGLLLSGDKETLKEPVVAVYSQGTKIVMPPPMFKPNVPEKIVEIAHKPPQEKPELQERKMALSLQSGEGLSNALKRASIPSSLSYEIISELKQHVDLQQLVPGHIMDVHWQRRGSEWQLSHVEVPLSHTDYLSLAPTSDGSDIKASQHTIPTSTQLALIETDIENSLLSSTQKKHVPYSLMMNVIGELGHRVDFQRDIRPGDTFKLIYEQQVDPDGNSVTADGFIYASLKNANNTINIYRYDHNGHTMFFNEDGTSVQAGLLKSPVHGARISSNFGMRKHPVLGYSKMHKGMDFAASRGTPILAAGDGIIERMGRNGGYGNYIRIRHSGGFSTAYAHLNGFAKKLKKGERITQGTVIGYVGSTGRSTGPHLHYEVLKAGKQINPREVKPQPRLQLAGAELKKFRQHVQHTHQQLASLREQEPKQYAKAD